MTKHYRTLYHAALGKIRQLEEQLGEQAIEVALMSDAAFEVRAEDSQNLAEFKTTNKRALEFVEKLAQSKSKFGKEAREILGYDS